jgi:hypothetical protein
MYWYYGHFSNPFFEFLEVSFTEAQDISFKEAKTREVRTLNFSVNPSTFLLRLRDKKVRNQCYK